VDHLVKHVLKYFAYGSNLLPARLRLRTPSCRTLGVIRLPGYTMRIHKKGRDGSAKCNALYTGCQADHVIGVLYEIDFTEKRVLDEAEGVGKGYDEVNVRIDFSGAVHNAFTYVADSRFIDESLKPFSWYKDLVVYGARVHALPDSYIEQIDRLEAVDDPDNVRARQHRRLLTPF
jgi:hypothetical protein